MVRRIPPEFNYQGMLKRSGLVNQAKLMTKITIKCTYQTSENPRGTHQLVPTAFEVELTLNNDGTIASWDVDDRTACFYTDLAKYDESVIQFEGSEIKGQTGSIMIDRNQCTFVQKSDVNGEWLTLRGICEEIAL